MLQGKQITHGFMNPIRDTVRQQKSRLRYVFFPINKVCILLLVSLQCWDSHSSCQHGAITVVPIGETDHIPPHPGIHRAATKRSTPVKGTPPLCHFEKIIPFDYA